MTKEQAEFLREASDFCGNQDCEIYEDYSGRGMYGAKTTGIVVNSLTVLLCDVITFVQDNIEPNEDRGVNEWFGPNVPDCSDLSQDNMGMDVILY